MQVILQKNVPNLGLVGEVVQVASGYFRNYLGPRQLALPADASSVKVVEHQKRITQSRKEKEKVSALAIKEKMESQPITIAHSAGNEEKLFGSITTQEIALHLTKAGFEIGRRYIELKEPIKTLGTHTVDIKLHPEVSAQVKIEIVRKTA